MNAAHLHLLVNHVPVIGTIVAILFLAYGVARRSPEVTRASAGVFVLLGVAGILVYLTGEPAEEIAEGLAGVSETMIEEHEEAALFAAGLLAATGALALGGLIRYRGRPAGMPRAFASILLVAALLSAGVMARTAFLGGQIRHDEIRAAAASAPGEGIAPSAGEREQGE